MFWDQRPLSQLTLTRIGRRTATNMSKSPRTSRGLDRFAHAARFHYDDRLAYSPVSPLAVARRRCASKRRLRSTFTVLGGSCESLTGVPHCAVGPGRATCFAAMTCIHLCPWPEAGTNCRAITGQVVGLVPLVKEDDENSLTRLCCLGRLELPTLHDSVTGLISKQSYVAGYLATTRGAVERWQSSTL